MQHHIQIALPDERYDAIASLAAEQGLSPESLAELWLKERQETELVRLVKQTWPSNLHKRYRYLIGRRQKEQLTEAEYHELLQLNDQVEAFDAKRLEHMVALARIRQISLEEILTEFKIGKHAHE